jgi:hypothetical protein
LGAPQQTRWQKCKLIDPPPPTSRASFARLGPRHAQGRAEGGEITVHNSAISRHGLPELCHPISLPSDQRAQGMPGARCAR